jgi:outer membrane receptor protein involved in Fe transport
MSKLITFLLCWFLTMEASAQSKIIAGTVKDVKNEVIPGATVKLLRTADSTMVSGEITNGKGDFQFTALSNGVYFLAITAMGQNPYHSVLLTIDDTHSQIILPAILLLPAKNVNLNEVVVKAKRPLIEQDIDKTIVNVEAMISAATSNTLEVLEKTPGITLSVNGEISLNGRTGVLVLIDGRATYMSGQDLAAYLKSIPGGILDKIELIDNPSAKYDAAGNAVINIRLKKNRVGGFTGSLSTGYSQGRYGRNNDALNLNYRYKKLNVFANLGYSFEKNYTDDNWDRRFFNTRNELTSSVKLENDQVYKNKGLNANMGLDYSISENTTYGFQVNFNGSERNGRLDYYSDYFNANHGLDAIGTGNTTGQENRKNLATNFNFVHKFGKSGREISGDINYLNYNTRGNQLLDNFLYQPSDSTTTANRFIYLVPSDINIYTVKVDYVQPLKNKARLEAGFKSSIVDNDNIVNYYNVNGTSENIDYSKSNHFKYHENLNAVYVNSQKTWKRIGVQLGLRVENTQIVGNQLGNEEVTTSRFTKNYTRFFPAIFLNYKLDSLNKNALNFSLTRRISRPNYQLLNPFLFFRDKYSYTAGNSDLNPQYQYRFELKFTHKQFLRMGLSYNKFINSILNATDVRDSVFITRPQNIGGGFMVLLSNGISLAPAKWWNMNLEALLSRIGVNGFVDGKPLDLKTYMARINLYNQVTINKKWSAEFSGYYASRDLAGQGFTKGMFRAYFGIQKKIWKEKGSVRLTVEDIFHSWVYHNHSEGLKQSDYFQRSQTDTRRVGVAMTYRFGKETFARKRRHNNNASDEEKGRVE